MNDNDRHALRNIHQTVKQAICQAVWGRPSLRKCPCDWSADCERMVGHAMDYCYSRTESPAPGHLYCPHCRSVVFHRVVEAGLGHRLLWCQDCWRVRTSPDFPGELPFASTPGVIAFPVRKR